MAGISRKRIKKNGKEVIKYVITYRDIRGKQHTAGCYNTLTEAKKELGKYDTKQNATKILTVDEITNIYIDSRVSKKLAKSTLVNYNASNAHICRYFKGVKYTRLTAYDWQKWLYKLEDETSPYIADACFKLLRAAFKYCRKYRQITDDVFIDVEGIKLPTVHFNHFDKDEILNMLDVCQREFKKYYPLFFTFLASGCREGEIFGLKKCYVNFIKHTIDIAGQYTQGEWKPKLKTDKSRRTLYMFPLWEEILKEHIENDSTDSEFVFHNSEGKPLDQSNVRSRFWVKLLKACGYPENYARIHDLRGSNSDLSIALGLPIAYSRDSLGHYDARTTLQYYLHNNQSMINDAVEKYQSFFGGSKKCEKNVSINLENEKSNIIQFPKNRSVG